jgi:hypothetical protein
MGALIGPLWAAFSRFVGTRIGQWIVSAMLFFGIQWASNSFVIPNIEAQIASAVTDSRVIALLGYLQVDRAVTIILSAIAARQSVNALRLVKARGGVSG